MMGPRYRSDATATSRNGASFLLAARRRIPCRNAHVPPRYVECFLMLNRRHGSAQNDAADAIETDRSDDRRGMPCGRRSARRAAAARERMALALADASHRLAGPSRRGVPGALARRLERSRALSLVSS